MAELGTGGSLLPEGSVSLFPLWLEGFLQFYHCQSEAEVFREHDYSRPFSIVRTSVCLPRLVTLTPAIHEVKTPLVVFSVPWPLPNQTPNSDPHTSDLTGIQALE